jgi:phosphoglucosamine mutase
MGADVMLVGPLPTPGISFITTSMRADAGVVISASHNPFQDNGIKIFSGDGFKLADELEQEIEDLIFSQKMEVLRPVAGDIGKARRIEDSKGRYIVFLKHAFPRQFSLDDFHVVVDCAHGATYGVAPHVFEELGARVSALNVHPDGTNINRRCGALHPEEMARTVRDEGADLGLAFDGDGDRLIVCDEKGQIVDGDCIMAICARELMGHDALQKKTLVATVMSNMGLEIAMESMGGALVRTPVGDRHVVECMRSHGYNFGGEQSGHLIFLDHITTGDGILAGLQLLAIMCRRQQPLSELATVMERFPQVLKNVRTRTRMSVEEIPTFSATVRKLEEKLNGAGRILVRPSGTEPVIRVMVEGQDEDTINEMADELCELISLADRM